MPAGKHLSQAQDAIQKLNEPAKPVQPKPVDDNAAVLAVVAQYSQAYNDRNIGALRRIWPTMDNKEAATIRDFFKMANSVASTYKIDQEPQISGDEATVKVTLALSYVMRDGRQQSTKPSSFTMTLRKKESIGSAANWQIQSAGR
jgi:hypothetical protein